jgi:ERCC4-related helicase
MEIKELIPTPRDYQKNIFDTCMKNNCLVVLPTGTGKTLIAVMLAIERFKKLPLEKILILAPTRPLVEQHFTSFKKQIKESDTWADMQIFTGKTPADQRKKIWQTAEFIFSTPQCISNDLKNGLYDLSEVALLIEDECHRCVKNYAYTFIAEKYKQQGTNQRVLGLTASPGSDKKAIMKICENLGIDSVEIRTRESKDVKPYLQELEFEQIEIDFPPEFEEIRYLLKQLFEKKVMELKNRKVLYTYPSKTNLIQLQNKLFAQIRFNKNMNNLMAVSACAQAIKIQHALELLETQTIGSLINYMKKLYEQSKENKGAKRLISDSLFAKSYTLATTLTKEHPKIQKIAEIVEEQIRKNEKAKILVFSQYRETVSRVVEQLNKIKNIKAKSFVGQSKKIEGHGKKAETSGLKQEEQGALIKDFSEGKINVLVATSIGEEGLDIPEVNEVIFYEPVPSAIRKIQRAGRTARLMPGMLKILVTKNTRDQAYYYASKAKEKTMHKAIDDIKNNLNNKEKDQKKLFE